MPESADSIDLRSKGWLNRLLAVYLSTYDPERAHAAVAAVSADLPGGDVDELSHRLAVRRLEGMGLRPNRLAICPQLLERVGEEGAPQRLTPERLIAGLSDAADHVYTVVDYWRGWQVRYRERANEFIASATASAKGGVTRPASAAATSRQMLTRFEITTGSPQAIASVTDWPKFSL